MGSRIIKKANENIEELIRKLVSHIRENESICEYVAENDDCVNLTCEQCRDKYCGILAENLLKEFRLSEKDFDKYSFKTRFYPMFEDDRAYYQYESYSGYHIHWIDGLYSLLIEDTVIFEGKTFEELEKFFIVTFEENEKR